MKRRQYIILGGIGLLVLGFLGARTLMGMREAPEKKSDKRQARIISVAEVQNDTLPLRIPLYGKLRASSRVEIFPEVSGVLLASAKPFKVGQTFKKGEVMLAMDGSESELNLRAQRSAFKSLLNLALPDIKIDYQKEFENWKAFSEAVMPNKQLPPLPDNVSPTLSNFLSGRNIYQQYYAIQSLENRQRKFTITAPYDGVIAMGDLNPGTLVRAGQKVGEFISASRYELQAAVSSEDIAYVDAGDEAILKAQDSETEFVGEVIRVGQNIDPATQRVQVYLELKNPTLKDGMYLEGQLIAAQLPNVYSINRNLISQSKQVYYVQDSVLKLTPVEIVHYDDNTALVKGLKNGTLLLDQVMESAFEGMTVKPE